MKVDYNPYEGREVTGVSETVISRGKVIVENGRFVGRVGSGVFLKGAARKVREAESSASFLRSAEDCYDSYRDKYHDVGRADCGAVATAHDL